MLEQNPFASLNPLFPGDTPIAVKESAPAKDPVTSAAPAVNENPKPEVPSSSTPLSSELDPSFVGTRPLDHSTTPAESSRDHKLRVAVRALRAMEQNLQNVTRLLEEELGVASAVATDPFSTPDRGRGHAFGVLDPSTPTSMPTSARSVDGRVVEGVFDGFRMVGADGKVYAVPPNYASKSKLVEGDMLKLTITSSGSFIFKQIGPIERNRVVAELGYDPATGEYYAAEGTRRWSVLKASVTYFRGEAGDEIILLVPMNAPSKWAAVENVIKKNPLA